MNTFDHRGYGWTQPATATATGPFIEVRIDDTSAATPLGDFDLILDSIDWQISQGPEPLRLLELIEARRIVAHYRHQQMMKSIREVTIEFERISRATMKARRQHRRRELSLWGRPGPAPVPAAARQKKRTHPHTRARVREPGSPSWARRRPISGV